MLAELPQINGTIKGLGFLAGTQRPFVGFLVKNWPLALIGAFAMFAKARERHKKGELSTYNIMADLGLVLSPLVGLALLNQLALQQAGQPSLPVVPSTTGPLYPPAPT